MFSTHLAPVVLGNAPATHVARVQAVVVIAQSLPLLVTNNALGALSDAAGPSVVLGACAAVLAAGAAAAMASSALRRAVIAP